MSEIKKGDTVEYSPVQGEPFMARVDHIYEYQGQGTPNRVNLKVLSTGESKPGMMLSRCKKVDAPTIAIAQASTAPFIDGAAFEPTSEAKAIGTDIVNDEDVGVDEIEYTGQFFTFGSIKLPIRKPHPATQHLIPKKRTFFVEEKRKDDFEDIFDSVNKRENILLVAEPGCGKSEFVLYCCHETNTPVVQIQGDGEMSVVDMVGGFQFSEEKKGTYWIDGVIPFALRHRCWILFDEINMTLPEVLSRLHSVMDDRRHLDLKEINEILPRTEDTVIFGTMNPSDDGRHVGTKPLSPALWSRFNLVVNFDFLEPENEMKLIMERTGVSEKDAKIMVTIAKEARKGFRENEVSEVVDTRMLLSWGRKAKEFGLKRGLKNTILSRLDSDSIAVLRGVLMSYGIIDPETSRKETAKQK